MCAIHVFSKTDVGRKRDRNEDAIRSIRLKGDGDEGHLDYWSLILADGMGGYEKGEVASKLVCDEFVRFSFEIVPTILRGTETGEKRAKIFEEAMEKKLAEVNGALREENEEENTGTTLVYTLVCDKYIYIGYVGDSRAYLIEGDGIEQITADHSYVNALLANGAISEEEAENHPMRNVITRAVGTKEEVRGDYLHLPFPENSYLLSCSDGLSDMLSDEEILEIVRNAPTHRICDELIEAANEKGGKDNISVILARNTPKRVKRRRT